MFSGEFQKRGGSCLRLWCLYFPSTPQFYSPICDCFAVFCMHIPIEGSDSAYSLEDKSCLVCNSDLRVDLQPMANWHA